MKSTILKFGIFAVLLVGGLFTSCSKEDNLTENELESYAEELVFRTQESTNMGRFGCYELVFPVSISFPNGETVEINTFDEMKQAIKRWRAENPRVRTRPAIAFPYSVVDESGEVILVENLQQQHQLRMECRRNFFENNGHQGHNDRPKICFRPVFPYSVQLPNGTVITINNRQEHKRLAEAIRIWRRNNPGSTARPQFVFPSDFQLEDGTVVTINNREELKALKESCN